MDYYYKIKRRASCCVPGCKDTTSKRHRFPKKNLPLFKQWTEKVACPLLHGKSVEDIYKTYLVCDNHFTAQDKVRCTRRGLMATSVPSLFLPEHQDADNKDDVTLSTPVLQPENSTLTTSNGRCVSSKPKLNLDEETKRIVWMDLEMTGLDVDKDKIMEIACVVTDSDLNILAESPNIIIHHPIEVLNQMNDWCKKQHAKTGLTEECLLSQISIEDAENTILKFLSEYTTQKMSPLAGNSVYMDRLFVRKYMPRIDEHLHYRIIDVSTVKELCSRWNKELYRKAPEKGFQHRAISDIRESISELQYYRKHFFNHH